MKLVSQIAGVVTKISDGGKTSKVIREKATKLVENTELGFRENCPQADILITKLKATTEGDVHIY